MNRGGLRCDEPASARVRRTGTNIAHALDAIPSALPTEQQQSIHAVFARLRKKSAPRDADQLIAAWPVICEVAEQHALKTCVGDHMARLLEGVDLSADGETASLGRLSRPRFAA